MLSDGQRHRLKQEKENLERQHQLLSEKIVAIELDVISQANTAIKFQNQRQVVEEKKNLSRIHDRLDEIENLIREDDKLIELAKFPEGVQKQFNNDNFEIQISEKIIKLKGIGPKDAPYDLIQPNCSTSPCKWEKINLDDKTKQKSAP